MRPSDPAHLQLPPPASPFTLRPWCDSERALLARTTAEGALLARTAAEGALLARTASGQGAPCGRWARCSPVRSVAAFLICACDVAKGSFLGVTVLGMTLVPIIYGRIFGWTMNSGLCSCAWSDAACAPGVMARVHCVSSVCVFLIHLCGRTCVFPAAKSHAVRSYRTVLLVDGWRFLTFHSHSTAVSACDTSPATNG